MNWSTFISLTSLAMGLSNAAVIVTWNTTGDPPYGNAVTYDGTSTAGGIRNTTTTVTGQPMSIVGYTQATGGDLELLSVPTVAQSGFYIEITATPAAGLAFNPDEFRVAIVYNVPSGNVNAAYEVRSSLDNFANPISTSAVDPSSGRNPISGTSQLVHYDIVADVRSLPDLTAATTFRLHFYDSDGRIDIRGLTSTAPEGIRLVGPNATVIPEPSTTLLFAAAIPFLVMRRRNQLK